MSKGWRCNGNYGWYATPNGKRSDAWNEKKQDEWDRGYDGRGSWGQRNDDTWQPKGDDTWQQEQYGNWEDRSRGRRVEEKPSREGDASSVFVMSMNLDYPIEYDEGGRAIDFSNVLPTTPEAAAPPPHSNKALSHRWRW